MILMAITFAFVVTTVAGEDSAIRQSMFRPFPPGKQIFQKTAGKKSRGLCQPGRIMPSAEFRVRSAECSSGNAPAGRIMVPWFA
jgi:hypothetical protein